MLTDFVVKNYRCFSSLHLKDLARVNLIAGQNNTGKTSLLEAVQLHCNPTNARLPELIAGYRGIENVEKAAEEVIGWFFLNRQPSNIIELSSADAQGASRALTIRLMDVGTARDQLPEISKYESRGNTPWDDNARLLVLSYQGPSSEARTSLLLWTRRGPSGEWVLSSFNDLKPWDVRCIWEGSGLPFSTGDVAHFSELEVAKRQPELLDGLKIVEPRLQSLSLVVLGGKSVIHGDIKGLDRLIPVPLMGEGIRRLMSILLAILNAPGGFVLVDEIENGLHYSVQKQVWQAIAQAARQADVQVFATTHSYECIQAAHEAFKETGQYDFALHRLDREDNTIEAVTYDQETLEYALEMFHEVR
jgi:hypothetical protein